jgi:hypothetical protein
MTHGSRLCLLLLLVTAVGCRGPGHVEFTSGECVIDGRPATLPEVEARQARISERILARQPLFVVITVLIVALAGFSHIEKLLLLFSTRRAHVHGLAERLRLALERYRAHPIRYFTIVIGTLSLLGIAGGFYVYLDADKRASERALGLLQFCHLALRNGESQTILAEQRRNLQAIESTAGNIQTLMDKLPPAEQRKAKEIVTRINAVLAQQGKLVGDYAARADESNRVVRAETENLEKGLSSLGAQVLGLKSLPASVRDLGEQVHALETRVGSEFSASDLKLADIEAKLDTLTRSFDNLDARLPRDAVANVSAPKHPPTDAPASAAPTPAAPDVSTTRK